MKTFYCLTVVLLACNLSWAQNQKEDNTPQKTPDPLPSAAFNQMIIQDITYAVIGESTPTSGIKIDVTKPEGTISGMFPIQNLKCLDFWGFEFKAGVTDKNFNLLNSWGSFNTAFEFKPSFTCIPSKSSAKYGTRPASDYKKAIVHAKNKRVSQYAVNVIDSIYVLNKIVQKNLGPYQDVAGIKIDETKLPKGDSARKEIALFFIKKMLSKDQINVNSNMSFDQIIDSIRPINPINHNGYDIDTSSYHEEVEMYYKKYNKIYDNLDTDTLNKMIANAAEIWTQKRYWWITFNPFLKVDKVGLYHSKFEGRDSSFIKSDFISSAGFSANVNSYWVRLRTAHLLRGIFSVSWTNNLSVLSPYNYETTTPFFTNGSSSTVKSKTGSAYNYDKVITGTMKQFVLEYYLLQLKTMYPGLYLSANINEGKIYNLPDIIGREKDNIQVGAEGGLVFNINSKEKDKEKNILSILVYVRYDDLTDKKRTSITSQKEESYDDFRKRNFSMGIKVGIPITVPQRGR